jgi:hypothetical protein
MVGDERIIQIHTPGILSTLAPFPIPCLSTPLEYARPFSAPVGGHAAQEHRAEAGICSAGQTIAILLPLTRL